MVNETSACPIGLPNALIFASRGGMDVPPTDDEHRRPREHRVEEISTSSARVLHRSWTRGSCRGAVTRGQSPREGTGGIARLWHAGGFLLQAKSHGRCPPRRSTRPVRPRRARLLRRGHGRSPGRATAADQRPHTNHNQSTREAAAPVPLHPHYRGAYRCPRRVAERVNARRSRAEAPSPFTERIKE